MKLGRCWLLLTAALWLLPQAAFAQGKKPGAAKPPPTQPAQGSDIEIDDPNAPKPAEPAAPEQPAGSEAPSGGICEIDPTACPKQGDMKKLAERPVKADVYAVQQIYALRR